MYFPHEKSPLMMHTTSFKITNMTNNSFITIITSPSPATSTYPALPTIAHPLGKDPAAHAYNANKKVDLEKAKFRLVFILWPTLIGISMAL